MYCNVVDKAYEDAATQGTFSTTTVEGMLKTIGFNITRKSIANLVENELITPPERLNNAVDQYGKRVCFKKATVKELIVLALASYAASLKGSVSKNKYKKLLYAKDVLKEADTPDSMAFVINKAALLGASFLVPSNIQGTKRLESSKGIMLSLKRIMAAMYVAEAILNHDDYEIIKIWLAVKPYLYTPANIERFAKDLGNVRTTEGDYIKRIEEAKSSASKVANLPEARATLMAWLEVCIIFKSGIKLLTAECQAYMKQIYGVEIIIEPEPLALLTLLNCLSKPVA